MAQAQPPAGSAAAAPPQQERSRAQPQLVHESYALANGLGVLLSVDRRLPRVAVNVWYHVGPVNEPVGRSGFAHLFEHLMFEGSRHVGRGFDHLMESMGASNVNGTTSWDRTNYYETVPSEHLETALWIESDRMGFMTLEKQRFEAQRAVVKNERRQSFDNAPYGTSNLAMLNALFPAGHPYHGAIIGSMEHLSRAQLSDVQAFYRTYYAPNNATLALVGNFDVAQAKQWIQKYFAPLPSRPVPRVELTPTPALSKPIRHTLEDSVKLARVIKGWIAPPAYSAAEAKLRVAASILAGGKATRLYQNLLVEQELASDVSIWVDANRLCSIVNVEATAKSGVDIQSVEAELTRTIRELANTGPSPRELRRAKRKLLLDIYEDLEPLNGGDGESGRAGLLQRLHHYKGDPNYIAQWIDQLRGVTASDVARAADSWLNDAQSATVITLPRDDRGKLDGGS